MTTCVVTTSLDCGALGPAAAVASYCVAPLGGVGAGDTALVPPCSNSIIPIIASPGEKCYWCPSTQSLTSSTASSSIGVATTSTSTIPSVSTPTTMPAQYQPPPVSNPGSLLTSGSSNSVGMSTQTSSPNGESTGLSNGAAAGVGIGCAFVGALLASLIAFFIFHRKMGHRFYSEDQLATDGVGYIHQDKNATSTTVTPVKGGVVSNIDRLLPQPAEDDEIIGGLSKIRDGIKNHVQNYYHNSPVSSKMIDESNLLELSKATKLSTHEILTLLLNPATRILTIRLLLAEMILSRCVGGSDGQSSFLPSEVSGLAGYPISTAYSALFSKWKTVSGLLLREKYGQKPSHDDPRTASISQALAAVEPCLQPFISPSADSSARLRNLEGVLSRAAQFAFLVFSQPSSFSFDFMGTGQPKYLVVFPAMLQTVSDEAELIQPPRILSEKEVVACLGA